MPKYIEQQRFTQYDTLFAALALLGASAYLLFQQLTLAAETTWLKVAMLAAVICALGAYVGHLFIVKLETKVTSKNLKVRLSSFIGLRKRIPLQDIENCEVIHYPTYAQRYGEGGWLNGETSISLTGRNGLAIRTRDGQSFFIGSRDPEALLQHLSMAA